MVLKMSTTINRKVIFKLEITRESIVKMPFHIYATLFQFPKFREAVNKVFARKA
jgi:hypothetical protein